MAVFPVFMDLKGKKCVVIGAGKVAMRKIETLLKFDAEITVVSPDISEKLEQLKWENKLVVIKKKYSSEDLDGASFVIAATSDADVNESICRDAVRNNQPVNVVDDPGKCTFTFPSVVKRDELVIGISTSGSYPALSKMLRKKIEEFIPESYGRLLRVLRECRERVNIEMNDAGERKEILEKLMDELEFYADILSDQQMKARINKIFEEYKDEKGD